MSRILIFLSVSVSFVLIACNGQSEKMPENEDTQVNETISKKAFYYTCPMAQHKHIANDTPGDCSECGMKLVAAKESDADSADYYGCPMSSHSHIRHEEAGKCEECNMDLQPMKIVSK